MAELYHQEISRTQDINREMLLDLGKLKNDYSELTKSIDFNMSYGGKDLPLSGTRGSFAVPSAGPSSVMNRYLESPQ